MAQKTNTTKKGYFIPGFLKMRKHQYLVVFLVMILGSLAGLLVSFVSPAMYEAESYLITNLELVQSTNITEIMVDSQLELIGQILYHPDITDAVLSRERQAGNPYTLAELKNKSLIERRLMTTVIKVRYKDPEIAARIATNWTKIAYERLTQAYGHALLVSEALLTITFIEDCQSDPLVVDTEFCQNLTPEEAASLAEDAQEVILAESPHALGLTKDLQISQYQPAAVPVEPIQGGRATLMLTGALIGLVFALILFELPGFDDFKEKA